MALITPQTLARRDSDRLPDPSYVAELTALLELTEDWPRELAARFLLSSNWLRDRGAATAGGLLWLGPRWGVSR